MKNSMDDLLEQAKKMQERMQQMQDELNQVEIVGEAGGGLIKVSINGRYYVKNVTVLPAAKKESEEVISDLIAAAFNDAVSKLEAQQQRKVQELAKGMSLPTGGNSGNSGGIAV